MAELMISSWQTRDVGTWGKAQSGPAAPAGCCRSAAQEDTAMTRAAGSSRITNGDGARADNGTGSGIRNGAGRYTDADLEPIRATLAAFARGDLHPRTGRPEDRQKGDMLAEIGQLTDEVGGQLASLNSELTQKAVQVR